MEVFDNQKRGVMTDPAKGGLNSNGPSTSSEVSPDIILNEVHVVEC